MAATLPTIMSLGPVTAEEAAASEVLFLSEDEAADLRGSPSQGPSSAWNEKRRVRLRDLGEAGRNALYAGLSDSCYRVTRQGGTDPADVGTAVGGFDDAWEAGTYYCACCDSEVYTSEMKYCCGCAWPGFFTCVKGAVRGVPDPDGVRTEIRCMNCDAHLGHCYRGEGFTNPPPNERHCVNSSAMSFRGAADALRPAETAPMRSGYTGPVYMHAARFKGRERARTTLTRLAGGGFPSVPEKGSIWVVHDIHVRALEMPFTYADLHRSVCIEFKLPLDTTELVLREPRPGLRVTPDLDVPLPAGLAFFEFEKAAAEKEPAAGGVKRPFDAVTQ